MGQLPYFAISVLSFPSLLFNFISSKGQHRIWLKMGKAAAMLFIFMISAATTMPMLVLSCDSPPAATPPTVPGSAVAPQVGDPADLRASRAPAVAPQVVDRAGDLHHAHLSISKANCMPRRPSLQYLFHINVLFV